MSGRPGRIERALAAIFDGERDNAFTIQDLCERIWPDVYQDPQAGRIERKHRSTVIRAARNIARQRPEIQWLHGERLGRARVLPARRGDVLRDGATESRPVSTVSQHTIALEQGRGRLAPRTRQRKSPYADRAGRCLAQAGRNVSRPTRTGMIRISPRCFGVLSMMERHLVDPRARRGAGEQQTYVIASVVVLRSLSV